MTGFLKKVGGFLLRTPLPPGEGRSRNWEWPILAGRMEVKGLAPEAPEPKFQLVMPKKWLGWAWDGFLGKILWVLGDF